MSDPGPPTITVMAPCKIPGCDARWWECHLSHGTPIVAEYEVRGADHVSPEHAAEVAAMHPGCDLVYIG